MSLHVSFSMGFDRMKLCCITRSARTNQPTGHTVAECLVAIAMLLPIAILVGKIGLQTERSSRDSVLASHALRDLNNAREQIGAWAYEDVSVARIQSISMPENLAFEASSRKWLTSVEDVSEPISAKRISLSLQWMPARSEFPTEVGPITFWVPRP